MVTVALGALEGKGSLVKRQYGVYELPLQDKIARTGIDPVQHAEVVSPKPPPVVEKLPHPEDYTIIQLLEVHSKLDRLMTVDLPRTDDTPFHKRAMEKVDTAIYMACSHTDDALQRIRALKTPREGCSCLFCQDNLGGLDRDAELQRLAKVLKEEMSRRGMLSIQLAKITGLWLLTVENALMGDPSLDDVYYFVLLYALDIPKGFFGDEAFIQEADQGAGKEEEGSHGNGGSEPLQVPHLGLPEAQGGSNHHTGGSGEGEAGVHQKRGGGYTTPSSGPE